MTTISSFANAAARCPSTKRPARTCLVSSFMHAAAVAPAIKPWPAESTRPCSQCDQSNGMIRLHPYNPRTNAAAGGARRQ